MTQLLREKSEWTNFTKYGTYAGYKLNLQKSIEISFSCAKQLENLEKNNMQ